MKILTFVIPAYNSGKFLDKCIRSMLSASVLEKLEILVVDDGSADDTAAVAQRYCDAHPTVVRLIRQENKGHGGALNTGCAAATGKYVKVIDADDWVLTENLPPLVAFLEVCESDVVLTHHHTVDVSTGEIREWKHTPEAFGVGYSMGDVVANWRRFDQSMTFHGMIYRTAFYQKRGIRLSEHVFYEDYEYSTYPCCHASELTSCDLFLYEYRIGDVNQSVSDTNQLKRLGHTRMVLENMTRHYHALSEGAGKQYAARKIASLLLSYFTTTLLLVPDRKEGRALAGEQMACFCREAPEIGALVAGKYRIFVWMNRLGIRKAQWERILRSGLYRRLRR